MRPPTLLVCVRGLVKKVLQQPLSPDGLSWCTPLLMLFFGMRDERLVRRPIQRCRILDTYFVIVPTRLVAASFPDCAIVAHERCPRGTRAAAERLPSGA